MSGAATILHVIPQLSRGGAARGVLTAVAALPEPLRARIVSLRPADPGLRAAARDGGVAVIEEPGRERLDAELAAADVVHIDFWNSPELQELLCRGLPPCRLVLWFHVGGATVPQLVTDELVALGDRAVASGPMPGREGLELLPVVLDATRVAAVEPRLHDGFVAGYIGTVDPVKMHPRYVELCAAVERPDARFVVCGSGAGFTAIAAEAERLGVRERFELRGWVGDVGAELAGFDVFGYPLRPDNYSTAELVLQEAMMAGVPPVVLPYGGAGALVEDGVTGLVAADERAYPRALERLAADPALRRRLGAAARGHARAALSALAVARRWAELYGELVERPKRPRAWPGPALSRGSDIFLAALGPAREPFGASIAGAGGSAAADDAIAASPPPLAWGDGGILDYRRRFPGDGWLRYWAGLVLEAAGRPALAAGELAAAVRLGVDPARAEPRLATLTEAAA